MQRVTIADKFDEVVKALQGEATTMSTEDMVAFIEDRKAKATAKSGNRKPTATQKANEAIKENILATLGTEGKTASEVMIEQGLGSNQKASALLRQLVLDGKVRKEKDGESTKFYTVD